MKLIRLIERSQLRRRWEDAGYQVTCFASTLCQGVRHKCQKCQKYHPFFHLFHDFSTLVLLALTFTPIGVGTDHVIKGANQRTLAAGNGESGRGEYTGDIGKKKKNYANFGHCSARHHYSHAIPQCQKYQKYHHLYFDILVLLVATESLHFVVARQQVGTQNQRVC